MAIIGEVRSFIEKNCPVLKEIEATLNVDFLGDDYSSFSIETVPCEPIVKKYINGDTVRRYQFVIASREAYGDDVLQNIENLGFYEKFSDWLEECNRDENFPGIGVDKEVTKIKALTGGHVTSEESNTARYQIQCELTYFQEA